MKKILACFAVLMAIGMAPQANAESVIYLFDNYPHQRMDGFSINGDNIELGFREFLHEKLGLASYKKGVNKIIVRNDGRAILVRDMTWANKPYHDEMTLDLNDGEVYYIELVTGPKSKLKLLKPSDGEKKLKKAEKDKNWQIFPEKVYDN